MQTKLNMNQYLKNTLVSIGGGIVLTFAASALAVTTAPVAQFNVADYGAVSNNTAVDNTQAFTNALAAAAAQGGGVVSVPPGIYSFSGTLTLPTNVVLSGTTPGPFDPVSIPTGQSLANTPIGAAVLLVTNTSAPFINSPNTNTGVENFMFYYPNQVSPITPGVDTSGPNVYPPTISTGQYGSMRISGCSFTNSYIGIQILGGRVWLNNLNIGAFYTGVNIDGAQDFVRLDNIMVSSFWDAWVGIPGITQSLIDTWVFNHGYGVISGRSDGLLINNLSIFNRYAGLMLTQTSKGVTFGNATNLQFDTVQYGVIAFATDTQVGFTINNIYVDGKTTSTGSPLSQYGIFLRQDFAPSYAVINVSGGELSKPGFLGRTKVISGGGVLLMNGVTCPPNNPTPSSTYVC